MMKIFSRLKIGILCICMIVLNLSSMTIVEVPRVSATTFPSSEDFESSDGVGTNPRIIGDWEFALLKLMVLWMIQIIVTMILTIFIQLIKV